MHESAAIEKRMTIQELCDAKQVLEKRIAELLRAFEDAAGKQMVEGVKIRRWNGSNECWGPVSEVIIQVGFE